MNQQHSKNQKPTNLIPQIAALPEGWLEDDAVFETVLQTQKFHCDFVETNGEGRVVWTCDQELSLATKTVESRSKATGKVWKNPVLQYAELAISVPRMKQDGKTPERDQKTGDPLTRRVLLHRGLYCYKHMMELVSRTQKAVEVGLATGTVPKGTAFETKDAGCFGSFPLYGNLVHLRGHFVSAATEKATAFFLAFAKGEKTVEDGRKEGFILPLPPDGEELPRNERGLVTMNALAVKGELVGLVTSENAKAYLALRKENEEMRRLTKQTGVYLYWDTLEGCRQALAEHAAKQAEWLTKQAAARARQEAEDERRKAAMDPVGRQMAFIAAAIAPTNGERRKTERTRRDGPKPQRRSDVPAERDDIQEGLDAAAIKKTEREAADAKRAALPEEPRGSQPPTLSASLGDLTGIDLTAAVEIDAK